MGSWSQPTADDLALLGSLAGHPGNLMYFFDRLDNPLWVGALREKGFFETLPEPVEESGGSIRYPPWPEGRYLARMASTASEQVCSVLKDVGLSQSPLVTRLCFEAAAGLPDEQLQHLAHKVREWVKAPGANRFSEEAATVLSRLLQMGKVAAADKAAGVLLSVKERPPSGDQTFMSSRPEAIGRFSVWRYRRVVEGVLPALADHAGLKGVKLLSRLLGKAIQIERMEGEDPDCDGHAFVWRPAIEEHSQNNDHGVKDVLVSAVRDASVAFAQKGESELRETISYLESRSVLYRRVALHVLSVVPYGSSLAAERISNRDLFDDGRVRHEYASLVRARFGEMPVEVQESFLGWIDEGPDLEPFRQRVASMQSSSKGQHEDAYVGVWQLDRLSFVESYLVGVTAERYQNLVAKFGEPEHADLPFWSQVRQGTLSPLSQDEMSRMTPLNVVEYLRTWCPPSSQSWKSENSKRGLGLVFRTVAKQRIGEFVPLSNQIASLGPIYVGNFLGALRAASEEGVSIAWTEPVQLMTLVVEHPFLVNDETQDIDRETDWTWARRDVAWLLSSGLSSGPNRIPFALRKDIWQLLERLTRDPDPSVAQEAKRGDDLDPHSLSHNSNRGTAMNAVVEYALWCRRELEAQGEDVTLGLDLMPEVRSVLERHLDPSTEPSHAVRAVYGQWLPWLLLLDEHWTVSNVPRIFSAPPSSVDLAETAWTTYIGSCQPYDSAFRSLRSQYEAAIDRIPSSSTFGMSPGKSVDVSLGEHLAALYWRGVISAPLLDRFFRRADDNLASTVMEYIGRALMNSDGDLPPSFARRIRELWNRRLETILSNPKAHVQEGKMFSFTFAAAKLDEDWELSSLERTVQGGFGNRWIAHSAVERLVRIATARPVTVTRLALQLLKTSENEWAHLDWEDDIRSILDSTQGSSQAEAVENRREIVDYYIRRGIFAFRNLL
ncbi:MAG: hypothetical protein OXS33_01730 [bacterium]|nr:hypothetical protein [bacterium]